MNLTNTTNTTTTTTTPPANTSGTEVFINGFVSTGKHMICDLHNIRNTELLNSLSGIRRVVDTICDEHSFAVLGKLEHQFTPQGCSLIYLLSESHISVHTFPEKNYIAMDIYTCREYPDNEVYNRIYKHLANVFVADGQQTPIIIDRGIQ